MPKRTLTREAARDGSKYRRKEKRASTKIFSVLGRERGGFLVTVRPSVPRQWQAHHLQAVFSKKTEVYSKTLIKGRRNLPVLDISVRTWNQTSSTEGRLVKMEEDTRSRGDCKVI